MTEQPKKVEMVYPSSSAKNASREMSKLARELSKTIDANDASASDKAFLGSAFVDGILNADKDRPGHVYVLAVCEVDEHGEARGIQVLTNALPVSVASICGAIAEDIGAVQYPSEVETKQ